MEHREMIFDLGGPPTDYPVEPLRISSYHAAALHGYADAVVDGIGTTSSEGVCEGYAPGRCVLASTLACRRTLRDSREGKWVVPIHKPIADPVDMLRNGLTRTRAIAYFDALFEIAALAVCSSRPVVWRWSYE